MSPGAVPLPADALARAQAPQAVELTLDVARQKPADVPLRITLQAASASSDNALLRVRAIEVWRAGQLLQRIDGLDTQTPVVAGAFPVQMIDMNFDGQADMRLVESVPAGPNTPYLNWLWDSASMRFQASPALNELSAPRFDAKRKQVLSAWRDGATRYGTDTYGWRGGQLLAIKREERLYSGPGRYTLKTYAWADGGWRLQSSQPGRTD